MQRLDEILNPRYEPTYDDGDCIFDIIKDDNKYYKAKLEPDVIDSNGITVKVILSKGKRITRKELLK